MAQFIDTLTTWLFQYIVVWMLLGAGVFFTLRLNFIRFRRLPEAFRAILSASWEGVIRTLLDLGFC